MGAWSLVGRMSAAKKLAFIAAGYALSVGGGLAAVAINELLIPADIAQTSPGMVAFGDMILFLLVAGFLSLAPSWFLLKSGHREGAARFASHRASDRSDRTGKLAGSDLPGGRRQPPKPSSSHERTARPAHRLRRHPTYGLWPRPAGDRGGDLRPSPQARHARASHCRYADGSHPAQHVRAAFGARDPLLGASDASRSLQYERLRRARTRRLHFESAIAVEPI